MTGVLELISAVNNEASEMEYMSFEGVPINRKIAYIAETMSNIRDFSISHGGVIDTDDVMGKKKSKSQYHVIIFYMSRQFQIKDICFLFIFNQFINGDKYNYQYLYAFEELQQTCNSALTLYRFFTMLATLQGFFENSTGEISG